LQHLGIGKDGFSDGLDGFIVQHGTDSLSGLQVV
jgi:L-asparaginase/Glu-tRNA(Gln) amidotransferase subunit D